jgi:catechol 2,3-dioxygenase-like lactoylglutathione lyase family enzyme
MAAADAARVHRLMPTTGVAHTAVCVADCDAAVAWYRDVLGMRVLSPPYRMEGAEIERDMASLVPSPVVVKAAIVGFEADDRVLEVIEYPNADGGDTRASLPVYDLGLTHVGLVCDDIESTRAQLETSGASFLVDGVADVAGLRTTWFRDPFGIVFILLEKRDTERPYYRQF